MHYWTDQELAVAMATLRGLPRGTTVTEARERIVAKIGVAVTESGLAHAFQYRGLQQPRVYIGVGDAEIPPAGPGRLKPKEARVYPPKTWPSVQKVRSVGTHEYRPTFRKAEEEQELDIPVQFDDADEPTAKHGRGNSSMPPPGPGVAKTDPAPPPGPSYDSSPPGPLPEHLDAKSGDTGLGDERLRVIVPDSHGCYIDPRAASAFLADLKTIDPDEIVFLGDHVDVSGMYSAHPPVGVEELEYSYETDLASAEAFIDAIQKRAPRARGYYLEGNHEAHISRHIARTVHSARDAIAQLELQAPEKRLRLKERGIRYVRTAEMCDGLSIPGTIRLGKCFFTHGFTAAKFATSIHCIRYGANVVHGHTHRVQEYGTRTVASDAIGGWCPGTLALLQPLYRHTSPTEWRHGYGIQAVSKDGRFVHVNVPLVNGWSGLQLLLGRMRPLAMAGGR